jgi:hypothetical protein
LKERFRATLAARLETMGEPEERVLTELTRRKLYKLRKKELADLLFKCDAVLAGHIAPVRLKKTYKSLSENTLAL